jgi:hypothetical protein
MTDKPHPIHPHSKWPDPKRRAEWRREYYAHVRKVIIAVDKLVREGRAEHVMIDGKPGVRRIDRKKST